MPIMNNENQKYASACMGHWLAESNWLNNHINAFNGAFNDDVKANEQKENQGSIGVLSIDGMMMKGLSWFGGTSTVNLRAQIRALRADDSIKKVLLHVDSGGGAVAGTKELADDIAKLNEEKEVIAFIEDLGASACYWACSSASAIYANKTAEVGSLGVVAVVQDTSEMYKNAGINVKVISTGEFKGAMTEGTEITEPMVEDMQERINDINEVFMDAVADGRGIDRKTVDAMADGRVHIASKALDMGLIDGVSTVDDVVAMMQNDIEKDSLAERQENIAQRLQGR